MPWEMIVTAVAPILVLLLAVRLLLRRPHSTPGPYPDVGQPPVGAKPMIEPRLEDIGFGSYGLPLPGPTEETDEDRY